ncbi:nuclear envelope-associated protein 2 [Neltuma alba]|uniref:nuclear envelope-associated protein 2 n=1 Tax=Neltuma alba TaxID=207710 RepID=UPI0010A308A9|nr:nuclear envelope-associated protein 2-like [Prosopis alba]
MSTLEKPSSSQSLPLSSVAARDIDPLIKDLNERKQSFRRNVVSLAAELKEARSRLISQEQSFAKETLTRQEAEIKARSMEEEIGRLRRRLEERNEQLQASAATAEKYLNELDDLGTQIAATRAAAEASVASAQSADLHYAELAKELYEKNRSLKEHEVCVIWMGQQVDNLQKDLQARESSQKQLKDGILQIEHDIMEAFAKAEANKNCKLRKILGEVSPMNFEKINELLIVKDEEIAKLKDEIKIMSSCSKLKIEELESQLEKQRCVDQELKKRVLKLEFCLQEARCQTRKLHKMEERRDKAIKDLRDQLEAKQRSEVCAEKQNQNFWDCSGFKIVASMSMLILVVFSKR